MALKPQELLDELFICEPQDIDLEAIAGHLNATVQYRPLCGCEARLNGSGDTAIITVNSSADPGRQRFSVAHEIAHWVHDKGRVSFECNARKQQVFYTQNDPESLANGFASELLLPKPMLYPRLLKKAADFDLISGIAKDFRTSLTSTACRIADMGSHPVMVVCTGPNKRHWYKGSGDVEGLVRPHRIPSTDSLAYRLLKTGGDVACEEVDADAWVDHVDASDFSIVESSFKVADDMVVSLLWWKSNLQLREIASERGED